MPAKQCETCGNQFDEVRGCQFCLLQLGVSKCPANGAEVATNALPSIAELNARFPQLEVSRLIGRGGMGAIYQARQTSLDRDVALKLITKEVSQDPLFVERFEREAKTLAKLSHPNIVTIYDFGYTSDGGAYLIMEFVDGINLREAMKSHSVGPEDALDVVATICRALEYAHSRGVIHRDIKPENILLGEDGCLKVVDFGIAKIVDDSVRTPTLTATRQVLGSLHYLAPEQLESPDQVDHRVDLYALGVVFYELLTGELPLGRYEPPSALYNRADARVDRIVLKSLSRKPVNRFQTAREFGTEIHQLQSLPAASESTGTTPATQQPPPLPNLASDAAQPVSVPFNCDLPFTYDLFGGLAEAIGILYANERGLCFEFRTRDKLMGVLKSKTHLVEIPYGKLTRCELVVGMFSSKLLVSASSLSVLSDLPNSETGTVELQVKRSDIASAKRLVSATGFDRMGQVVRELPLFGTEAYTRQAIFGGLMILSAFINLGSLAIGEVYNANAGHPTKASLAAGAICLAVLFGPIALMQLLGGIMNFVAPMRSLNGALTVVSMLPIAPAWLLSFPAAIWASPWIRGDQDESPSLKRPAWGATTLMFIRESRWSKAVAVANAIGLSSVALLGVGYLGGFYPTKIAYRVSANGKTFDDQVLSQRVLARISDVAPGAKLQYDPKLSRLTISDWKRSTSMIQEMLAIEAQIQLASLIADSISTNGDRVLLPLAGKITTQFVSNEAQGLSASVATEQPLINLAVEAIGGVSTGKPTDKSVGASLTIELTAAGREQLAALRLDSKNGAIGLVINGLVEGIATAEGVTNKRLRFELSEPSEFTAESIEAAIRGPALPCELELIR